MKDKDKDLPTVQQIPTFKDLKTDREIMLNIYNDSFKNRKKADTCQEYLDIVLSLQRKNIVQPIDNQRFRI